MGRRAALGAAAEGAAPRCVGEGMRKEGLPGVWGGQVQEQCAALMQLWRQRPAKPGTIHSAATRYQRGAGGVPEGCQGGPSARSLGLNLPPPVSEHRRSIFCASLPSPPPDRPPRTSMGSGHAAGHLRGQSAVTAAWAWARRTGRGESGRRSGDHSSVAIVSQECEGVVAGSHRGVGSSLPRPAIGSIGLSPQSRCNCLWTTATARFYPVCVLLSPADPRAAARGRR